MKSAQSFGGRNPALLLSCALLAVVAAIMAAGTPRLALAQGGVCGPQTLRGLYIFSGSGYNIVGGVPQPITIVEFFDFEGDGTMTVPTGTLSFNGNVNQAVVFRGVYTLERSLQGSGQLGTGCRGTLTLLPGVGFDLYTDRTGTQVWLIRTAPGAVFQGTVTKLSN
jgi:hypothetical protein